jgi:serine/threonine protein kinase
MGDVYRATDTSLRREVAVKVLPPAVATDTNRLARFRREAHTLASLNHPHVAAIYGFEEVHGTAFLILELVEGETLAERLRRGPLPLNDALDLARQVAEGLEAAHERGIVHRDLKPANIKVTPSGIAKVLDFGLAKAYAGDAASSEAVESPTRTLDETALGVVVGTTAYMAPEQVRGRPLDKRADVWAFGVVLYEMLTTRRPFEGASVTDLLAAVVSVDPDWSVLPAGTPPAVRRLLRRCLQRDLRLRLPDIGAARLELTEVLAGDTEPVTAPGERSSSRLHRAVPWMVAALAVGGAAYTFVGARRSSGDQAGQPLARLTLEMPSSMALSRGSAPLISPDGRHLVVLGQERLLYLRRMDALAFEPLAGTEGATSAFWSPDSGSIAFTVGQQVKVVMLTGAVRTLSVLDSVAGTGTWNASGLIVLPKSPKGAFTNDATTLVLVSVSDGRWTPLTSLDRSRGEIGHSSPEFLPDGRRVAFYAENQDPERSGLVVASLDAPAARQPLTLPGTSVRFAAGHGLVTRNGSILAYPFDPVRLEPTGEAVLLAGDAESLELGAPFSASRAGVLVYQARIADRVQLAWVARDGTPLQRLGRPDRYSGFKLSRDERRAALTGLAPDGRQGIWTLDLARGVATVFALDAVNPLWSPDGTQLVFTSSIGLEVEAIGQHIPNRLFRKSASHDGRAVPVLPPEAHRSAQMWPKYWTPDARMLLYLVQHEGRNRIFAVRLDEPSSPVPLDLEGELIDAIQLSPDGRWLTYIALEHGRHEVFMQPFGRPGERIRVSPDGGGQPRWRADGRELYYVTPAGALMAVTVAPEGELGPVHHRLFDIAAAASYLDQYAPSRNGQRFLVMLPVPTGLSPLRIVSGWHTHSGTRRNTNGGRQATVMALGP